MNNRFRFAHHAMATTFDLLLADCDQATAFAARSAAVDELDRLEAELSRFLPSSDVGRVNSAALGKRVRVGADLLACLKMAGRVHQLTRGLFDVTLGAHMDDWRAASGTNLKLPYGCDPSHGFAALEIDYDDFWVARHAQVLLDLGAIGKGYAVDCIASLLREHYGIPAALVHGGESSALGYVANGSAWMVDFRHPCEAQASLGTIRLNAIALSGSGTRLRGQHIIDPRTGQPACLRRCAWALHPSAAISDAFSTACMLLDVHNLESVVHQVPDMALIIPRDGMDGLLWMSTTISPEMAGFRSSENIQFALLNNVFESD